MAQRPVSRQRKPKPEPKELPSEMVRPPMPVSLSRVQPKQKKKEIICYCRMCQEVKPKEEFYSAVDPIDQNGFMSICKPCIKELFMQEYALQGRDIYLAVMYTCRWINLRYEVDIVDATLKRFEDMESDIYESFFGYYKGALSRSSILDNEYNGFVQLTAEDIHGKVVPKKKVTRNVKEFWGDNYSESDYLFLEKEFDEWSESHDINTKEQEVAFKIICQLQLDYEKARIKKDKSASKIITDIHKAMEVAGVSPGKAKPKSLQEVNKTVGMMIKMMEETTPAEHYEDKELFSDYDDIDAQIRDFVTRPILNFLGKTPPDFYVENDGEGGHGGDIISDDGFGFYDDDIAELDEDDDVIEQDE